MSQQLQKRVAREFCSDIHGPQRIKSRDVGDPLTFPLATLEGSTDSLCLDDMSLNLVYFLFSAN